MAKEVGSCDCRALWLRFRKLSLPEGGLPFGGKGGRAAGLRASRCPSTCAFCCCCCLRGCARDRDTRADPNPERADDGREELGLDAEEDGLKNVAGCPFCAAGLRCTADSTRAEPGRGEFGATLVLN